MKRYILSTTTAMLCAGALAAAQTPAQTPAQQPSQPGTTATQSGSPTDSRNMSSAAGTVTLVGCLYNEKDVPGRTPNLAERAGVMEDYILADAAPASGASATPGATGTSGTTASGASSAAKKMYKVEQIDDEKLKPLVGKRVEVIGKLDSDDAKNANEVADFEATSIRAVEGTCPATPAR